MGFDWTPVGAVTGSRGGEATMMAPFMNSVHSPPLKAPIPTRPRAVSPAESTSSHGSREEHWQSLTLINMGGGPALRRACREGDESRVLELLAASASPHSYDEAFERTPLHQAAHNGCVSSPCKRDGVRLRVTDHARH